MAGGSWVMGPGQHLRIEMDESRGWRALSSRLASRASMAARHSFSAGLSAAAGAVCGGGRQEVGEGLDLAVFADPNRQTSGPCGYSMNHVSVSSTSSKEEKVCRRSVRWRVSPAFWESCNSPIYNNLEISCKLKAIVYERRRQNPSVTSRCAWCHWVCASPTRPMPPR